MEELFEYPPQTKSIKVELPTVKDMFDGYKVRLWLLGMEWREFEDWLVAGFSYSTGIYEVWFTDIGKACYFKLSFSL